MKKKEKIAFALIVGASALALIYVLAERFSGHKEEHRLSSIFYGDIRDYYADMLDRLDSQLKELEASESI